ncbi:uncharacterized protein [Triticum aestivum]|uniref:uncharacterized protein isoform X1 n=1 Tax=Triticum aestivum TaxID=4565 RepID=UPI001D01C721|nr:uncharacterized protein LOC123087288 isoform X1 [Triticum aestivum]
MLSLVLVGLRLEQQFGFVRVGVIYLVSDVGGSMMSSLFIRDNISVGASGTTLQQWRSILLLLTVFNKGPLHRHCQREQRTRASWPTKAHSARKRRMEVVRHRHGGGGGRARTEEDRAPLFFQVLLLTFTSCIVVCQRLGLSDCSSSSQW